MFDLEQAIADWRKQMLAAGIETPAPLEELEIHLREEIERRVESGLNEQMAFEIAAEQIGCATLLRREFIKASTPIHERLKQIVLTLAGIPNYQLATNMNASNPNTEPRWATYLKSAVWIFPALFVWIGCFVLVLPKLKEVCAVSHTKLPGLILFQLAVADAIRKNLLLGALIFLAALVLAEWRWRGWSRYRRLLFGIAGFCLNFSALFFLASLLVLAVLAASNLAHPH